MKLQEKFETDFSEKLRRWYRGNKRDLPWRRSQDPYPIWISEIMLQQTQVDTVIPYFLRFMEAFPDVNSLATASLDNVLKAWEGLGYYARARNLHSAARTIVNDMDGRFPSTYQDWLKIRGIGPYTAAAIASIALNENHAVLDGNVVRVLARILKIADLPSQKSIKTKFERASQQLLPAIHAGDHNQAMMELGALICTPTNPQCSQCPVSVFCEAFRTMSDPSLLPAKAPSKVKPHYDIAVGIIRRGKKVLINRRPENGLLGGLWEFPGGKLEAGETLEQCVAREIDKKFQMDVKVEDFFMSVPHAYTHFRITLHAFQCIYKNAIVKPKSKMVCRWVTSRQITEYAFPRSNRRILDALLAEGRWPLK